MNCKAEGRLTTFTYSLTIALAVIMVFATLVVNISSQHGNKALPEFDAYQQIYDDYNASVTEIIASQDTVEEDEINSSDGLIDKVVGVVLSPVNAVTDFWDGSIIRRAWNTIKLFPKSFTFAARAVQTSLDNSNIELPMPIIWLMLSLLAMTGVILVVRAIWEKKT